jgi:hypothetical protein
MPITGLTTHSLTAVKIPVRPIARRFSQIGDG